VKPLKRFEKLAERLIEAPFTRLFKTRLHPADLARALAEAMETGQIADGRGGTLAPNHYRVMLHPDDYRLLHSRADVTAEVAAIRRYLEALVAETGSRLSGALTVSIEAQEGVAQGDIRITADHLLPPQAEDGDTRRIPPAISPPADRWQLRLPGKTVRLGMPIVRLGQSENNDIPIPDKSVSPYHAQLRWRNGVYYAQNLSRTAPLLCNRQPVTGRIPLKAGDTLQLGRVTLQIEIADDS